MIVISMFCFFIAFHQYTYIQRAPSIDAGNPTQNPPQEGMSDITGTTGFRTSDSNEGPASQYEEGNHSGIW